MSVALIRPCIFFSSLIKNQLFICDLYVLLFDCCFQGSGMMFLQCVGTKKTWWWLVFVFFLYASMFLDIDFFKLKLQPLSFSFAVHRIDVCHSAMQLAMCDCIPLLLWQMDETPLRVGCIVLYLTMHLLMDMLILGVDMKSSAERLGDEWKGWWK